MTAVDRSALRLAAVAATFLIGACSAAVTPAAPPSPTPSAAAPSAAAPSAAAPSPVPTPTPTPQPSQAGPLGDGRQIHTATLLADGSVLVAGGYALGAGDTALALASAERYDPATGVFKPTGTMAKARGSHTGTLLPGGKVLIAGGGPSSWDGGDPTFLDAAELYDPQTGTFSATGPMSTPRESHTATLLPDGRVLIVGGEDQDGHAVATAEIYDPKSGTFSPTGSMAVARAFHTATPLPDGRVLVVGGNAGTWSYSGPFLASAEIYNPKTGRFSPTGSMTVGRVFHAAVLLPDGRVLVEGGGSDYSGGKFLSSAELYDPKAGTWTATGSMANRRNFDSATLLTDSRVLVAGGFGDKGPLASAELYNPKTGTFSSAG